MMVAGLCRLPESIAASYPEIGEETFIHILIAHSAEQGPHAGQGTRPIIDPVVIIMRVHQFGTQIEPLQRKLVPVWKEKLVTVSYCESQRIIMIFVITSTYETAADLPTLTHFRESPFIGDLGTAAEPGQESDLDRVQIVRLGRFGNYCILRSIGTDSHKKKQWQDSHLQNSFHHITGKVCTVSVLSWATNIRKHCRQT